MAYSRGLECSDASCGRFATHEVSWDQGETWDPVCETHNDWFLICQEMQSVHNVVNLWLNESLTPNEAIFEIKTIIQASPFAVKE